MPESKQPRVFQTAGGGNCTSYWPGHNTHWIPAIRKYVSSPRQDVSIRHIEGNEFEVTFDGQSHRWFYHDPDVLARCIVNDPTNFVLVSGTSFVNYNWHGQQGSVAWFYLAEDEYTDCIFPQKGELFDDAE